MDAERADIDDAEAACRGREGCFSCDLPSVRASLGLSYCSSRARRRASRSRVERVRTCCRAAERLDGDRLSASTAMVACGVM